jgi:aminopeptidase N
VLIPSFQFGGMEHPGFVFYNASSMLLDESATQNQFLGRASLISTKRRTCGSATW